MYSRKRPLKLPTIILLALLAFVLAACAGRTQNVSWPGLSTDGENVYVAYGTAVLAYNVATESQVWTFPDEPSSTLPFYAPPSVQGDRIILGDFGASGGFFSPQIVVTVYGLESSGDGILQERWSDPGLAKDRIIGQPLQVDDRVFLGTADNTVLALDAANGSKLWEFKTDHSNWAKTAYQDGVLYVASLDKHVYALNADDGSEIWRTELTGALAAQPIIDDQFVYVAGFDSQIHALDIDEGTIEWTADATDWIWSAPALVDGVLYYADSQGNIYAVDATDGSAIWDVQVPSAVQTSPVIADGKLIIASEGDLEAEQGILFALSLDDGSILWQTETPAALYTTPVIVKDLIIVVVESETDLLVAYDFDGAQQWSVPPPAQ